MKLARTGSDEAVAELIKMAERKDNIFVEGENYEYKLEDQLAAIEALGETNNKIALDYLFRLLEHKAPNEIYGDHCLGGYYPTGDFYPAEFPNAGIELDNELAEHLMEYMREQNKNDKKVLDYRSDILDGNHDHVDYTASLIKDKKTSTELEQITTTLREMDYRKIEEAGIYFFRVFKIFDSQTRNLLKEKGNTYIILESAFKSLVFSLARTMGEEVVKELTGMVDSEGWYHNRKGSLIIIETLGETRSKTAMNYLEHLEKHTTPEACSSANCPIKMGRLKYQLNNGYKNSLNLYHQSWSTFSFKFADNAYLLVASTIDRLKEKTN